LAGVLGRNSAGNGVVGTSDQANAVLGGSWSRDASGVRGENLGDGGFGVTGRSNASERVPGRQGWGAGVFGDNTAGGWAGFFNGGVRLTGTLFNGGGGFSIDRPGDEQNRVLNHSFVETPDMMNVYNGNVVTDGDVNATIQLSGYLRGLRT
jgi:hypothetical protein